MRASRLSRAIALCLAVPLLAGNAAAEPLRAGGTGSALGLLRQVGAEFASATGTKIDVVPALGSSGAVRALADGKLDIAISARPPTADQAGAGLIQLAVLRTAFVFATSHRSPNGLKSGELARIYAADKPTWADGTPVRIILRPRSEADSALLGQLFGGMDAALEAARRRTDLPSTATDQDNVDLAKRVPGSLIGTTTSQLATEHLDLRVLSLDGVAPSFANFESGVYPFAKKQYVIVRADGRSDARRFVEFLRSPQGVTALRAAQALLDPE